MNILDYPKLWVKAFLYPGRTFARAKGHASLEEGGKHVFFGALIAGIISAAFLFVHEGSILILSSNTAAVLALVVTPIAALLGWLVVGSIQYAFARLFGGRGDFGTQLFLVGLYLPVLIILRHIASNFGATGIIVSTLLTFYGLYLLTIALREAHGYSTARAFLTWFVPFAIAIGVLLAVAYTVVSTLGGIDVLMGWVGL